MEPIRLVDDPPPGHRAAVMQAWVEHESGWGQRPDGWSLHVDDVQFAAYLDAHRRAPHGEEFDRPDGRPFEVLLAEADWQRVAETRHGLRLFGRLALPDVGWVVAVPEQAQSAADYLARLHDLYG